MGKYRPKVQKQVSFAGRGSKKQLIWIFQSFGNSWIFQETHQPNGLCSVFRELREVTAKNHSMGRPTTQHNH